MRLVGVAAAGALLSACASRTPSHVTLTYAIAQPRASDYWTAIAAARSARDRAAMLPTPTAADFGSASDEEIARALRQWASARRDATQAAHRAYTETLLAAREPADEAEVHGELADLWLQMAEDTRSALFAATPAKYRDDPSLVSAVQGATVYALRPVLDRVAGHIRACERVAREAGPEASGARLSAAVGACADVVRRLDKDDDPRAPASARQTASLTADRALVPTTHPKPCTFKGTLSTHGAVYASETGTAVVLPIEGSAPIEVESLAVPTKPGGRYKVTVSWPKAVDGYLETEDAPFVLLRRIDLGSDEVWAQGERFAASEALGPTVRVIRAASGVRDERSAVPASSPVRRLFCHDLGLVTTPRAAVGR